MLKYFASLIWAIVVSSMVVSLDCLATGLQAAPHISSNPYTTSSPRVEPASTWHDPSPHHILFVLVDKNVQLEVLDWGGSGRSLVVLAGLGNTAHIYDGIAPKLAEKYHVIGITRRGFGASSSPATGYTADRLGDDVIDVLDTLKIVHPVLVGHSIAGEELSSVGTRYPTRIAGLVYLDAAYLYAYQNPASRDLAPELEALQKRVEELMPPAPPTPSDLANFSSVRSWRMRNQGVEVPEAELRQPLKPRLTVISPVPILSRPFLRQFARGNRSSRTFGSLFSRFTRFRIISVMPSTSLRKQSVPRSKQMKQQRLAR